MDIIKNFKNTILKKEKIKIIKKVKKIENFNKKIAIQIHAYYPDLLDDVYNNLIQIPYQYDVYISTDTNAKAKTIIEYFAKKNMKNVYVEVFKNKGRDILPFIEQIKPNIEKYDYICHLHTKKSKYSDFGDKWRKYLYFNLMGNKENIETIFYMFEKNKKLGIIYPKTFETIKNNMEIVSNKENIDKLCSRLDIKNSFNNIFPSGSMFWIRSNILKKIVNVVDESDFVEENGQIDGTFAHAIERIFVVLTNELGYDYIQTINEIK